MDNSTLKPPSKSYKRVVPRPIKTLAWYGLFAYNLYNQWPFDAGTRRIRVSGTWWDMSRSKSIPWRTAL